MATEKQKIVVVGAGPVGALAALYAANRGHQVEVYELRADLRDEATVPLNFTRSINLALAERGRHSLKLANRPGLLESILEDSLPMSGRMVHGIKGGEFTEESQAYDIHGRSNQAIDRAGLNKRLLDELDKLPNIKLFFNHRLTGADFKQNKAWFEQAQTRTDHAQNPTQEDDNNNTATRQRAPEIEVSFDLLIGCDGAHSAVRFHMMKYTRMDYSQTYIDTLWCEFRIAPSPQNTFQISPSHLHIWPGTDKMFIAIPSTDASFVCTLFAPAATFDWLDAHPDQLVPFFNTQFPGVADRLIPADALHDQYKSNPHLPLISITCAPHHVRGSAVILGDAAHAMVPFYGQGMNAGLEDVRVLFDFLDAHNAAAAADDDDDTAAALAAYSAQRVPDARTICDLALRNYWDMRQGVTDPLTLYRKKLEEWLSVRVPWLEWATQYSRVSFGNMRYSETEARARRQKKVLVGWVLGLVGGVVLPAVAGAVWWGVRMRRGGARGWGWGLGEVLERVRRVFV